MRTTIKMLLAAGSLAALSACAQSQADTQADTMSKPMAMTTSPGMASGTVTVGGQPMLANRTIVDNAVNSRDHETLVAAVTAAGLVDTLRGAGPFTVFAPTDAAFERLPPGTVETLVRPENKAALTGVLTYHVVPGRLDMAALQERITAGNGSATLETASGGMLTAMMNGPSNVVVRDAAGQVAAISTYDVYQSNGVIHVVDSVLMPK
ncbi:fasciclin domain-containing protein [Arenibaculum sp.]|jgi:uncharacterized surface protein with fasciclin (FAS1) repeats|uniref:fasciclin domain-containing protein n=1 Tax=Arenibaculum sp. TaxID=2865862 RepID=UPI002E10A954|nr:fasciclin domain-containing protein [Arenibaculum sp.]